MDLERNRFRSQKATLRPSEKSLFTQTAQETAVQGVSTVYPVSLLTLRYFEIQIESLPEGAVIAIGLKSDSETPNQVLPGWEKGAVGFHSDDGKLYIDSGEEGKKYGPQFKQGDRIGCGLQTDIIPLVYLNDGSLRFRANKGETAGPKDHFRVFFTHNGEKLSSFPVVSENYQLSGFFPYIGFDNAASVATVTFNPNYWIEPLKNLGKLQFKNEEKSSDCFKLNPDLIKMIFSLTRDRKNLQNEKPDSTELFSDDSIELPEDVYYGLSSSFLLVSKHLFNILIPQFHFIDVPSFVKNMIGVYSITKQESYSLAIELKSDGTYKAKIYLLTGHPSSSMVEGFRGDVYEGFWGLKRAENRLTYLESDLDLKLKKELRVPFTPSINQSWQEAADQLPKPQMATSNRKCGVPLEEQIPGEDCCSEIVTEIVNQVWEDNFLVLGCDVKEDIIKRVSLRCMKPPGMSNDELRVTIAEELAICSDWRETFKSLDQEEFKV